jgi:hypothetical protein
MAQILRFVVAEIQNRPVWDEKLQAAGLPNCPLREFGDCAKIDVPAVAANVPVNASAGGSRFGSENQSQE